MINKEYFSILYNSIYTLTAFTAILSALSIDISKNYMFQYKLARYLVFFPIFGLIFIVGLRAYNVGTDTINYYIFYWQNQSQYSLSGEFLFPLIMDLLHWFNLEYNSFIFLISLSFYTTIYLSFKKISSYYQVNIFFVFFVFFSLFIANSLSINIIRQGISLGFLLLAYSCLLERNRKSKIISLLFISFSFHTTSIIPIILYFLCFYFKKIKLIYFYFIYIISSVLAFLNFSFLNIAPFLIESIVDDKRENYFSGETYDYIIGFKFQFFLLNTFFLFIFSYIYKKIKNQSWKNEYLNILKYFILSSATFFMAFQIPFSDRFGLFSWITIPICIAPLFSTSITNIKKTVQLPWILLFFVIYVAFYFYNK